MIINVRNNTGKKTNVTAIITFDSKGVMPGSNVYIEPHNLAESIKKIEIVIT